MACEMPHPACGTQEMPFPPPPPHSGRWTKSFVQPPTVCKHVFHAPGTDRTKQRSCPLLQGQQNRNKQAGDLESDGDKCRGGKISLGGCQPRRPPQWGLRILGVRHSPSPTGTQAVQSGNTGSQPQPRGQGQESEGSTLFSQATQAQVVP